MSYHILHTCMCICVCVSNYRHVNYMYSYYGDSFFVYMYNEFVVCIQVEGKCSFTPTHVRVCVPHFSNYMSGLLFEQ